MVFFVLKVNDEHWRDPFHPFVLTSGKETVPKNPRKNSFLIHCIPEENI